MWTMAQPKDPFAIPETLEAAEAERRKRETPQATMTPEEAQKSLGFAPFVAPQAIPEAEWFETADPDTQNASFGLGDTDMSWKKPLQNITNAEEVPIQDSPNYSLTGEPINSDVENTSERQEPGTEQATVMNEVERIKEEGKCSPLIDDFVRKWFINGIEGEHIKECLVNDPDNPQAWIERAEIPDEHKQKIYECIKYIESWENIEQGRKDLEADYHQELKEFRSPDGDLLGFWEEAITLLARSYTPNKNQEGEVQSKDAINLSFEIAANTCIFDKSIKRPESFNVAMKNVKNWDLNFGDRFAALQSLLQMTNKDQWIKGRKKQMEHMRMKKWREIAKLEKEIQMIQYDIEKEERESNDIEKVKKLRERQSRVREMLSETVKTWEADMMWGWELDAMANISPEAAKENN